MDAAYRSFVADLERRYGSDRRFRDRPRDRTMLCHSSTYKSSARGGGDAQMMQSAEMGGAGAGA